MDTSTIPDLSGELKKYPFGLRGSFIFKNMAHDDNYHQESGSMLFRLWDSFWNPPRVTCPKCGTNNVEYYDPFFFSPVRTLKNRRRIRCCTCHFIWRPNRKTKSMWDNFKRTIG